MLTITVQPYYERRWLGEQPLAPTSSGREQEAGATGTVLPEEESRLLYHQWRMYHATAPLVINTHATGTGKTLGALLRLLARVRQIGLDQVTPRLGDTLFIAPTNELIEQHVRTASAFCQRYGLPYRVLPVTRDHLQRRWQELPATERSRHGQLLRHLLSDPATVQQETVSRAQASIFVTNPDIFYYILTASYNRFDRGPLLMELLRDFSLVIIDEVHYYSPRQLAAFLFFLKLSAAGGYLSGPNSARQICLLTATPSVPMRGYLERLGIETEWIEPEDPVPEAWADKVELVRALTPVQLAIYSAEELVKGQSTQRQTSEALLSLVQLLWPTLRRLLEAQPADGFPIEGAVLSSSLRTINLIYRELQARWPAAGERVGRITGPQRSEAREQARERQLILATPTVDIGYNFERTRPGQPAESEPVASVRKPRPSLDFLLFEAWSGDELLQRLGRVGRVLALPDGERCAPCQAWAVVDQETYRLFDEYHRHHGTTIDRETLAKLAARMPARQDLTAYVRSGVIGEFFRTLGLLGQGMADEDVPELESFLQSLQQVFAGEEEQRQRPLTYRQLRAWLREYEERARLYGGFSHIPAAAFERFAALLNGQQPKADDPQIPYLKAFDARLPAILQARQRRPRDSQEGVLWLKQDLSRYAIEHARWTFREGFETPQVLVFDPQHLLSDEDVTPYDLFHLLRSYDADFYATVQEWRQACFPKGERRRATLPEEEVLLFCRLHALREQSRQVGLYLEVPEQARAEWEEAWAYRPTALWGLRLHLPNDDSGLPDHVRSCLQERFVPIFVAAEQSRTVAWLMSLRQKARFFPMTLDISFADRTSRYRAVLGPLALQLAAEIPRGVIEHDQRQGQQGLSEPLFF